MNSEDSRNLILAIVLSVLVLIGWNYLYTPQLHKDHVAATPPAQTQTASPGSAPAPVNGASAPQVRGGVRRGSQDPRRGARPQPAGDDRHAGARRFDRLEGRPDRRPRAQGLSRDDRSQEPAHHLVLAAGRPCAVLGRQRLRHGCEGPQDAEPIYPLDRGCDDARCRQAGDADMGQRRRPEVHAHHRCR